MPDLNSVFCRPETDGLRDLKDLPEMFLTSPCNVLSSVGFLFVFLMFIFISE